MGIRDIVRRFKPSSWMVLKFVEWKHQVSLNNGWLESFRTGQSIDQDGEPLPWITYDAISFLQERINPNMTVFEYGCGNSTLWWASRVKQVTACEHHQEWFEQVSKQVPENVTVLLKDLDSDEEYEASALAESIKYDVIIVDGRKRVKCVNVAVSALADGGMIILDNSDRPKYAPAINLLREKRFSQMDFPGLAPISTLHQQTSIFIKTPSV